MAKEAAYSDNKAGGVVANSAADETITHVTEQASSDNSSNDEKTPEAKEKALEDVVEADADLEDEEDPEIKDIPPEVRRIVSLHDDTTLPTITFRYFLLSVIFIIPGAFLSQSESLRGTPRVLTHRCLQ